MLAVENNITTSISFTPSWNNIKHISTRRQEILPISIVWINVSRQLVNFHSQKHLPFFPATTLSHISDTIVLSIIFIKKT